MRAVAWSGLVLACLVLGGCRATSGKSTGADPGVKASLDLKAATGPTPAAPPAAISAGGPGLLAGQVLDNYNRRPPPTFIQVSASRDAPPDARAAPIEIAADKDGYFLIQGLEAGKHYQLSARAKDGTQVLAGTVWVTPPNPRVIIRISADLVTTSTPPMPSGLVPPPPAPPAPSGNGNIPPPAWPGRTGDQGWAPGGRPAPNALTPERPAGLGMPAVEDSPRVPVDPTRIGAAESVRRDPPVSAIPAAPTDAAAREFGEQPPIPFCSLSGRQLSNFALYDLNGQPWEWRQRNNKLTLIDFWGTWCPACLHAIPHLNILNEKYSKYGLEVVGIAYENNAPKYQVEQVRRVAQRLNMHYTLLLGGDRLTCPVRVQFRVAQWPTLFLVDQSGRIIWQASGLDKAQANELDKLIRKQLGMR